MTPIAFVDTETDGLHPDRKAWEVAVIRRDDTGAERTLHVMVQIDLATSDPFALRVGDFYGRHPLGRWLATMPPDKTNRGLWDLPPQPAASRSEHEYHEVPYVAAAHAALLVARWTHGAHIVGAVPNFDTEVFDRMLRAAGVAPAHHHHLIDVEALAVGYLRARGEAVSLPWKSDDLSRAVGVEPPSDGYRHTALGDARWAMEIYDRIMGEK